jgi:D-methionine transport system ATP-binding protein
MSVSSPGSAPAQSSPAIQLRGLIRHFRGRNGAVTKALDGVSLDVAQGEIFGIVGRSGAGKSTLIRCVNLLERPTQGEVRVMGEDLMLLDDASLRQRRRGIGMVFQHFNLPKPERDARVAEVLGLVGLTQKAENYPAQLSGGQKQRVGIARALAPRPRILLCDEATSALDPETTHDILGLIRRLRDKLDLTVLLITHEMAVVKEICDRVAVMEAGKVLEEGRVFDVFTRPAHATTRSFIAGTIGHSVPPGTVARLPAPQPGEEKRLLQVLFAGPNSTRAVISEASRRFGIDLDIISGRIDEIAGEPFGLMALAAYGPTRNLDEAVAWFEELGLTVTPLAEAI